MKKLITKKLNIENPKNTENLKPKEQLKRHARGRAPRQPHEATEPAPKPIETGNLKKHLMCVFEGIEKFEHFENVEESNKHHYMHASMIIALFSVLGGLRILTAEDPTDLMIASHLILIVVGTIFMVGGILSFRHARKLRESLGE